MQTLDEGRDRPHFRSLRALFSFHVASLCDFFYSFVKLALPFLGPSSMPSSELVLKEWAACRGTLSRADQSVDIVCDISCSKTGELNVALQNIPLTSQSAWLLSTALGSGEAVVAHVTLSVTTPEGDELESRHVYFSSVDTVFNGVHSVLRLGASAQTLSWKVRPLNEVPPAGKIAVMYHTIGMKGFGAVSRQVDEGNLTFSAPITLSAPHDLSGCVTIQPDQSPPSLNQFVDKCDLRVDPILRVISLSQGRLIKWSVRRVFVGESLQFAYFRGANDAGPEMEAALHHFNLDSILDLAVTNFGSKTDSDTGVLEAIEWLMIFNKYAELRFLAASTAFEHLLRHSAEAEGSLFSRKLFKKLIRPTIEAALASSEFQKELAARLEDDVDKREGDRRVSVLCSKLGDLNRLPFQDRLEAFLSKYQVPLEDLPLRVNDLLKTRNRLVHGSNSDDEFTDYSLTSRAGMMREVLRRTILAILGFEGQFQSWARGPESRRFRAKGDAAAIPP